MEELKTRLQQKQEQCGQLETNLKESRDKLLTSEQSTEQLEGRIKVCVLHGQPWWTKGNMAVKRRESH